MATQSITPAIESPPDRPRLDSVDLLRGTIMVLMVLDHVREFFGDVQANPTDPTTTTVPLFFTRWVTHFCAPTFIFLAGTGAYLAGARGMSRPALSRFLLTRGLWLIVLEVTAVRLGMTFDPSFRFVPLTVLWVIGLSMMLMAALVFLPSGAVGAVGVAMIVGHNALDGVEAGSWGRFADLWRVLHQPGPLTPPPGVGLLVLLYPLIPWAGVMMAGYAFGRLVTIPSASRRRALFLGLGTALTAAFVALRWSNLYGDPGPWGVQPRGPAFTLLSFLNCNKYPPSLLFLLMTLGPAIALLAMFDGGAGRLGRPLVTLGRVPLFFYLLQWPVIHVLAIAYLMAKGQPYAWLLHGGPFTAPQGHGFGLPVVYAMWFASLALLYPPCRWFAGLKRRRKDAWLSYL